MRVLAFLYAHMHVGFSAEFPDMSVWHSDKTDFCILSDSLNWQHMHCAYPQPNPDIRTLFVDHICVPIPSDDNLFSAASDSNPLV